MSEREGGGWRPPGGGRGGFQQFACMRLFVLSIIPFDLFLPFHFIRRQHVTGPNSTSYKGNEG